MSRIPLCEPPELGDAVPPARILHDLRIKVVTPIFGGSAEAGQVDPRRPVCAKSIRGHLRFWWRACRAGQFQTAADLYSAEEKIWGSTSVPSAVDVIIKDLECGKEIDWIERRRQDVRTETRPRPPRNFPAYALFPFQGQNNEPPKTCQEGVAFTLRITLAKGQSEEAIRPEIEAALWAWILFGGVGARTRRGCGSLFCENAPENWQFKSVKRAARAYIKEPAPDWQLQDIPILHESCLLFQPRILPTMQAWESAVNLMRDFRQRVGFARNEGEDPRRPGRSRWPEPDSIRRLSTSCERHAPIHKVERYFPRADLGMPIIFHFPDARAGCPDDHTLAPCAENATRMSSPIILKPLAMSAETAIVVALRLNVQHVWQNAQIPVLLKSSRSETRLVPDDLNSGSNDKLVSPLKGNNARDAFMSFAQGELSDAKEVVLCATF